MTRSTFEEIVESGAGAVALSFGVIAGWAVYTGETIAAVATVLDEFWYALSMTVLPSPTLAAYPGVLAFAIGASAAARLEEPISTRIAGFVATYAFLAVLGHYALATT